MWVNYELGGGAKGVREGDRKGGEGTGIQPEAPWVCQASGVMVKGGQGSAWGQASECHGGRYFFSVEPGWGLGSPSGGFACPHPWAGPGTADRELRGGRRPWV